MSRFHRSRGGQIGNHNGLKSGFYSKAPLIAQKEDCLAPEDYGGELERAIIVTRMNLRSLLDRHQDNHRLVSYNISLLDRLIRTRRLIADQDHAKHRLAVDKLAHRLSITQNSNHAQEGPC